MFLKTNCLLHNLTKKKLLRHTVQTPKFPLPGQMAAFISNQLGVVFHQTQSSLMAFLNSLLKVANANWWSQHGKGQPSVMSSLGQYSLSSVVYPEIKVCQKSQTCKQGEGDWDNGQHPQCQAQAKSWSQDSIQIERDRLLLVKQFVNARLLINTVNPQQNPERWIASASFHRWIYFIEVLKVFVTIQGVRAGGSLNPSQSD